MKIITIMNLKGGVGKTTTAASIAYILGEEMGERILIADADQQGNISALYGRYDPEGLGMPELLETPGAAGTNYHIEELIQPTEYKNIDIIPGNSYLMQTNMDLLTEKGTDRISRFKEQIQKVSQEYSYCVIDCGLIMDMVATNALIAADMVIVPVMAGGFEIGAVREMQRHVEEIRKINTRLCMKAIITMRQRNKASEAFEEYVRYDAGVDCFRRAVRRSVTVLKATIARKPLPAYAKNGIATQDYREVAAELKEYIYCVQTENQQKKGLNQTQKKR